MALAKSWEMRPAPAIPHRVGSNADIFEIFVQVSKKIYNPCTTTQIFALIPLSPIRKTQIHRFLWLIRKYLQNAAQLHLKTVLKVVFENDFSYIQIWISKLVRGKGMHGFKSAYQKGLGSQIANPQSATFAEGPQI
jgi:hypothetical protein